MFRKASVYLLSLVLLFTGNALFAEDTNTKVVISRGIGATADAALKDAFVQAVQQVVGVLMSAETMVENDNVIKDNVLTYSDGFVSKYDVIRPAAKTQAGLFEITIKAVVEQKKLLKKLEEANVVRNEVKGMENVWAQMVTQEIRKEDSVQILMKALELLNPVDYLVSEFVDNKGRTGSEAELMAVPQKDGETVKVSIGVAVRFDQKKYVKEVLPYLKEVLDKTCMRKKENIPSRSIYVYDFSFKINKNNDSFGADAEDQWGNCINVKRICKMASRRLESSAFRYNDNEWIISLNTSKRYNVEEQTFTCYAYPKDMMKRNGDMRDKFSKLVRTMTVFLTLQLKDEDGEIIRSKTEGLTRVLFVNAGSDNYDITPEFQNDRHYWRNSDGVVFTLELNKDDLKDVKSMEVKLEMKK